MKKTKSFTEPKTNMYFVPCLLMSLLFVSATIVTTYFVPDLINKKGCYWDYLFKEMIWTNDARLKSFAIIHLVFDFINYFCMFFTIMMGFKAFFGFLFYKPWLKKYINYSTQIINSCDHSKFNDRIAFIVTSCNDFAPRPLLQSFLGQTYQKNCDYWILDDSSKKEVIQQIDNFAKKYGFHVIHRPEKHKKQHPSCIGNISYFLNKHANEYDYILEVNSSSILTNTFVENALCYFHTPGLNTDKIAAVRANSSFYESTNLFSYFSSIGTQFQAISSEASNTRAINKTTLVIGNGSLWKASILAKIPLDEVECPGCDSARTYWLYRHGYEAHFNPFDFQGKLSTQNIYRLGKQRMKWATASAFIFKHYMFKKYDNAKVTYIANLDIFCGVIAPIFGVFFGVTNLVLTLMCTELGFSNLTGQIILIGTLAIGIGVPFLICWLIGLPNVWIILGSIFGGMFEMSQMFRTFFKLFVVGIIGGKWSSKAVTIKTATKLTFKQWVRINLLDVCWLLILAAVCAVLIKFTPLPWNQVVSAIFGFLGMPSICWFISSFFSFIPYKKGWDDSCEFFDIARRDIRYRYIKDSEIWKKQHPNYPHTKRVKQ